MAGARTLHGWGSPGGNPEAQPLKRPPRLALFTFVALGLNGQRVVAVGALGLEELGVFAPGAFRLRLSPLRGQVTRVGGYSSVTQPSLALVTFLMYL